ncbi:MAG: tRNA 2-thiouridine(34) synthase MnmA [Patescibacteria group bacterium]
MEKLGKKPRTIKKTLVRDSALGRNQNLKSPRASVFVGTRPNSRDEFDGGQVSGDSKRKGVVFVGMSGGVDSSVTAWLLKNLGYDVTGVFMRCFNVDGCSDGDAEDARRVAGEIGIPFYEWDFIEEYKQRVVAYMIEGYKAGVTPNPDIECNREIKFGFFLEKALKMGADYVATGHYVKNQKSKIKNQNDNSKFKIVYKLFQAKDKNKDQSYFLWTLEQEQLKHCLFPIGDYVKPEVREIARKAGLSTAAKKDSQGICFLGRVNLDEFLMDYLPAKRGLVLDVSGKKLGEHNGAHFYTIGQRQGVGNLKHQKGVKLHKPLYVVSKDVKENTVTVAEEGDENLYVKEVELTGVNFINRDFYSLIRTNKRMEVWARVRYRQPLARASITYQAAGIKMKFNEPQKFVAPGQSAVFYSKKGDPSATLRTSPLMDSGLEMIGGGVIL